MSQVSRRRFLKISAASVIAASFAGRATSAFASLMDDGVSAGTKGSVRQIPTFCDICFWKCGAIAHVRDGKLWKFEGNPLDPQSRGRLCPRGTGAVGAYYDPDRLQKPLIRRGARGSEEWTAVTWDEAFTYIAMITLMSKRLATDAK